MRRRFIPTFTTTATALSAKLRLERPDMVRTCPIGPVAASNRNAMLRMATGAAVPDGV